MLQFLQKIADKPSDTNIRLIRIVFALILIALIYFGWNTTRTEWGLPNEIKYGLYIFPIIGLIRGIFDPGLFQKRVWKWIVFSLGVAMMIYSLFLIEDTSSVVPVTPNPTTNSGIDVAASPVVTDVPFSVSTDNFFGFFGFTTAFIGYFLNNKNLTRRNEKYGEVIKKIRV